MADIHNPSVMGPPDFSRMSQEHILAFNIIELSALGVITFTLLVGVFARSVHRMKSWFLFLASVLAMCVAFLLLIGHQSGAQPPIALCLMQGALLSASCPFVASSAFCFIIEMYLRITSNALVTPLNHERIMKWIMHIPPLLHTVVLWVSLLAGVSDLSTVRRNPFGPFCQISHRTAQLTSSTIFAFFLLLMLGFEVYMTFYIVRLRRVVRRLSMSSESSQAKGLTHLFFRMVVFTLAFTTAAVMDIHFKFADLRKMSIESSKTALVAGTTLPALGFALVFGTQSEILRVLIFWKPKLNRSSTYTVSFSDSSTRLRNVSSSKGTLSTTV